MKRRNNVLAVGGALALLVALPASVGVYSKMGEGRGGVAGAVAGMAQSVADLISGRSPGARGDAQLSKVKAAFQVASERDEPLLDSAPPGIKAIALAPPVAGIPAEPMLQLPPVELLPETAGLLMPPVAGMTALPPGGVVFTPPGVPPPVGGIVPPGPIVPPVVPPTGVIPEPGTWALMLLAFGLIGTSIRRNRRAPTFDLSR